MSSKFRYLSIACLLIFCVIGCAIFLFEDEHPEEWDFAQDVPFRVYINEPKTLLQEFEIIHDTLELHSDWYLLIDPIPYVIANGIIKSFQGATLLDIKRPIQLAMTTSKELQPTILVILPSHHGQQGAQNLARRFQGSTNHNTLQWEAVTTIPSIPKTYITWEGHAKHILISLASDQKSAQQGFQKIQPSTSSSRQNKGIAELYWNGTIPMNLGITHPVPLKDLSIKLFYEH